MWPDLWQIHDRSYGTAIKGLGKPLKFILMTRLQIYHDKHFNVEDFSAAQILFYISGFQTNWQKSFWEH